MFLFIFRWLSNRVENKSDKKLFHPFSRARHKTWARKTKQKWEIGFAFRLQLLEGVYFLPVPQFVSDVKDVFLRGKNWKAITRERVFTFIAIERKKERKKELRPLIISSTYRSIIISAQLNLKNMMIAKVRCRRERENIRFLNLHFIPN